MLIEFIFGIGIGTILFLRGMPSLIPLLIWLPALNGIVAFPFLLGLCIAGAIHLAVLENEGQKLIFFPSAWIAILVAFAGILFIPNLEIVFPLFEKILPTLLATGIASLMIFSSIPWSHRFAALFLAMAAGWFSLHEWSVPLALPALLFGLFGFSLSSFSSPKTKSINPWLESILGVGLGIIPGLGPGLITLGWKNNYFSPAMGIANLIFSFGMAVYFGKVRSAPAAVLVNAPISMNELVIWILAGCFIAWGLRQGLHFIAPTVSTDWWVALHVIGLAWLGGVATLFLAGMGFALFQFFKHNAIPVQWGLVCLIPSIWWFYFP